MLVDREVYILFWGTGRYVFYAVGQWLLDRDVYILCWWIGRYTSCAVGSILR